MTTSEKGLRGLEPTLLIPPTCHPERPSGPEGSPLSLRSGLMQIGIASFIAVCASRTLAAQSDLGLPTSHQNNILATARSPLYFQPWVPAHAGTRVTVALDYANTFELAYGVVAGSYVQDLELATVRLSATRDLSPTTFVSADLPIAINWKGGLDGLLRWWHNVLGIDLPERDLRPEHRFAFRGAFANGASFSEPPSTYLGDLRIGAGWRFRPSGQLTATLTLPTTTADGYGRGVVSLGTMLTGWSDLDPRLRVEGSLGLGWAPRNDAATRAYQRDVFGSVGGGFRWRFYRGASMFGTLWLATPYYARTTIRSLDDPDMAFDFGWIFRTKGGAEWRVGMTEDPLPSGPGVDAVFKASRSW